jgi:2,3,4,5-tetrahydropyridine-2,6-dicarboxylate N-succinyltransferase
VDLKQRIEEAFDSGPSADDEILSGLFARLMTGLNEGKIRSAEKRDGEWRPNPWVKKGILLGFRIGRIKDMSVAGGFPFFDKHTFPLKSVGLGEGLRLVPGGSAIRNGVFIGKGVTCMPPMYINVGAYVDDGTMIDSHALVGSCAQVGKRVHISACTQIGGVLEPVGSLPVIIEDDVLIGGNCGIYEGTVVGERAVIGAGTIITGATPVYDLVRDVVHVKSGNQPLVIPPNAVVIPGSRPILQGRGKALGLHVYSPLIIKYRDEKTEKSIQLEDLLR